MTWTLILFSVVIISSLIVLRELIKKKKYQAPTYLSNLEQITPFFEILDSFDDYVTWVHRDKTKSEFSDVGKYFKGKSRFYKKEEKVKKFNDIFQNIDNYIVDYNKKYVQTQKEKLSQYFDDIEGKKLDDQQRTALITDEYSNLIIAGAGSGKTLTIIGKVKYIIEQKSVKPENILLLSFTKKTVDELNERLKKIGLDARATTFHKLGYD
ncbi:MAG: ATP-dependent helicase, partial [Bacteroidales bacterium]|nr:ATP-dependent helicase [Bacteroidales bacterium]